MTDPPSDPVEPIDPAARMALLAAIGVGARLNIACGYAKLDPILVRRLLKNDRVLAKEIFEAECRHQVRNLLKLERADQVQAAIFALERRWPKRFARPRPQKPRTRKKRPKPVDLTGFDNEWLDRLNRVLAEAWGS
jgi:hypothetical protein